LTCIFGLDTGYQDIQNVIVQFCFSSKRLSLKDV